MQMGISVSHSSSPNWHLTAAPHGLLAGCVSARFSQRRKQQRRIKHHPAERALSPAPFTPFTPSLPPPFPSFPFQLSHAGSSLHPRQPTALIIASLSRPVALISTPHPPLPVAHRTSTVSPGSPPMEEQHDEDIRILKMFCIQAQSQKRADIWPRFQNLIFI